MQRVRGAVGSALFHNNEPYYEVAKDTTKTDRLSEVAELADHSDRAIRIIKSKTPISIFASPLPRAHFCTEKVWRNP